LVITKAVFQCLVIVLQNLLYQIVKRINLLQKSALLAGKAVFNAWFRLPNLALPIVKQDYFIQKWIFKRLSSKNRFAKL
jgi:hypothetical protein